MHVAVSQRMAENVRNCITRVQSDCFCSVHLLFCGVFFTVSVVVASVPCSGKHTLAVRVPTTVSRSVKECHKNHFQVDYKWRSVYVLNKTERIKENLVLRDFPLQIIHKQEKWLVSMLLFQENWPMTYACPLKNWSIMGSTSRCVDTALATYTNDKMTNIVPVLNQFHSNVILMPFLCEWEWQTSECPSLRYKTSSFFLYHHKPLWTLPLLAACRTGVTWWLTTSLSVAEQLEYPSGIPKIMGSILVGDSKIIYLCSMLVTWWQIVW